MHSGCRSISQKSPPDIKVFSSIMHTQPRKLQAPRDSYDLVTMVVGRFRNRPTTFSNLLSSSSSSSYLPNFLAPLQVPSHALLPSHRPPPRCIISPISLRRPHMVSQCSDGSHVRRLPQAGLIIVLRLLWVTSSS